MLAVRAVIHEKQPLPRSAIDRGVGRQSAVVMLLDGFFGRAGHVDDGLHRAMLDALTVIDVDRHAQDDRLGLELHHAVEIAHDHRDELPLFFDLDHRPVRTRPLLNGVRDRTVRNDLLAVELFVPTLPLVPPRIVQKTSPYGDCVFSIPKTKARPE